MSRTSRDQVHLKYVYLLAGMALLFWLGSTVVDPILPLQIVSVGASEVELGWIISFYSLTSLISRIPLAIFTVRFGVRRVILFSAAGRLLALVLYALAPSPALLYPARVLDGISLALLFPALMTEVSRQSLASTVGSTMGRFLTSIGVASVMGPVICGVLLEYLAYSQVILAALPFPALVLLFSIRLRRDSLIERSSDRSSGQRHMGPLHALKQAIYSRNLTILVSTEIAFSTGRGFILAFFAVYVVNELGLSPSTVALAFASLGLGNLLARFPSGMLCDRIGKRKPVMLAFFASAVALFLIANVPSLFPLVLSMALFGLAWGMRAVASWTIVSDSVEEDDRKLAAAYNASVLDAGGAIGAVSSGFLAATFSTSDIFLVGSGLMLGALVTVLLFRNWPTSSDKRAST